MTIVAGGAEPKEPSSPTKKPLLRTGTLQFGLSGRQQKRWELLSEVTAVATALRAVTLRATVAWRMHAPVACVAWKPDGRATQRACYSARKPACLRDPRAGAHLRRDLWTARAVRAAEWR